MSSTEGWFGFGSTDVWTCFHSCAFDFSVWEIWGALLYGGRIVMVPYSTSRSPEDFYRLLVREKVTVLNQTPSAFKQLMAAEERLSEPEELNLRYVIFGGEALDPSSLKAWFGRHGDEKPRLINMYGITETTVHVTYRPLGAADVGCRSVIGVPIPDLQLHILGEGLQALPVGTPGEIYVGGEGVARGYLKRPELTAERFLADPFSARPGARLYRTGDRARSLPNGDIEYLGRCDDQVKIRGFRIELGEIESVLREHPLVLDAVVVVRSRGDDKQLVAFLRAAAGQQPAVADLRQFLKDKLAEYMVPAFYHFLEKYPLTVNGKIDRAALLELEASTEAPSAVHHQPGSALEESVAAIWRQVLGVAGVDMDQNFFDAGGSSLLIVQVQQRVAEELHLDLPVAVFFQYPTVHSLARHLASPAVADGVPSPIADRAARQRAAFAGRRAGRARGSS